MPEGILDPAKAPHLGRFFAWGVPALVVLGSLALFMAWAAPNHYPPWTSFHNEAAAFAALCFFCLARILDRRSVRVGHLAVLFLPLALLVGAQWAVGLIHYGGDALLSVVFLFGAALAFWLGENSRGDGKPDPVTWLASIVVASASLSVLVGVLQWQRLEQSWGIFAADRAPSMRVMSNLGQPNHLATLCLMAIVLAFWLRGVGRLRPWQFVVLVIWLSMGMVLSESRSGLAGAVAAGGVLLSLRRHIPGAVRPILSWWAGLAAGFSVLPVLNRALYLDPGRTGQHGSDNERLTIWRQAVAAIGDAPWVGHGWRQTLPALKQAALHVPGTQTTDYAHNLVLDVLVWVGVPMGVLLLAGMAFWLVRAWRRVADLRQAILLVAAVPVLVHSQFEFPFAYAYFLFPLAWLLGALADGQRSLNQEEPDLSPRNWIRRPALLSFIVAYGVLCSAIGLEYLQAEEDYRVMRFELRKVGRVPVGYEPPELTLLTQLGEMLEMGRLDPAREMTPDTLRRLAAASSHNGWATLDLNYAAALAMNGQPVEAGRQLKLLRSVYGSESAEQAYRMFRAFSLNHPNLKQVRIP